MAHSLHQPFAALSRFDSVFFGVRNAFARRRAYNGTLRGLNALTDRDLADLGFLRCDLRRIAHDSVETKR